ncbi:hypothetical protein BH760_gp77 [Gordonia phage Splinter]|uniref:Uncharacterized protein n=2 Tax=Vendettavirus vendetta TaxID=2049886 RepID=A0A160DD23_9CAUD|nr:hypothetical protein BH795_gp77 [Gordonia phage Vendetta]YP_009275388.1 hypothetical protein BH760_gp77 [Gordonia phage Splinter]ANA85581.1 hypothetical protein PBI_VENDETTA_34 [Gordonia phage Vendetta]ANA85660.1 hypothetical protein PBI_SPLINTER_34 [Gordonia phage Splinter]
MTTTKRPHRYETPAQIDAKLSELHAKRAQLRAELDRVDAAIESRDGEFAERGGWSRAFLVTNNGGHVHKSTRCGTCYLTTTFLWLTDMSGMDEAAIVDEAGERACTSCYPDAPVDVLKRASRIRTAEDDARDAARAERDQKRAERAAKVLLDPETGRPVRGEYGELKTERGAELEAMSGLKSLLWYGPSHPGAVKWIEIAKRVAVAKAAKHDTDQDVELAALKTKAMKAHKRDAKGFPEALARTLDDVQF